MEKKKARDFQMIRCGEIFGKELYEKISNKN